MNGEGCVIAHNGVRGDNGVEVREAREQPNHQSDEEDVLCQYGVVLE